MSWNPALDPHCPTGDQVDAIETVIIPRARDLGGFEVRRALPAPRRQMVGPFIFFDQMDPAEFVTGKGIDVRPHPHIGLGTVTYLLKGRIHHRDSLGTDQWIEPGAVNWMTAGRGIAHSERTLPEERAAYENDPLNHACLSVGLGPNMMDAGTWALKNAETMPLPSLLLHSKDDKLTGFDGSEQFTAKAPNSTLRPFENVEHEMHNDVSRSDIYASIIAFIRQHT